MQLTRLSLAAASLLATLHAEDFVSVQYLHYDESDGRISVSSPSLEINKDFGVDYTLNVTGTYDAVSGASPTWYDATSGASGLPENTAPQALLRHKPIESDFGRGPTDQENVKYGNVRMRERRNAVNTLLTTRFASRDELKLGLSYSLEFDLYLYAGSIEYLHYTDASKNRAFSVGLSYERHVNLVPCGPYSSGCDASSGSSARIQSNHFNLQTSFIQVVDASSELKASLFYLPEMGYLTNSYKNVVRDYDTAPLVVNENRPDSRNAGGAVVEYFRALTPDTALHAGYRYYIDDWKMQSHTPYLKLFDQITENVQIELGYRYYLQNKAYFYNGAADYFTDETYASSDDRLSTFNAYETTIGGTWRFMENLSYNLSYSHYEQSTHLRAHYITTGFKYRF